MTPRYIVTGATGGLGTALVRHLPQGKVWAVVRRDAVPSSVRVGARVDVADARWDQIVEPDDVVFHLAAFVHRRSRRTADLQRIVEVNVASTTRLAYACKSNGAKLIFASTVAVFGAGSEGLSDASSPDPCTAYARSKLAAEEAIRAEGPRGLRYVILRFPLLYGPNGRGNMEKMLRAMAWHAYLPVGDPATRKSCLFFDDAARALVLAAHEPQVEGSTFVVSPDRPDTLAKIHEAGYRSMGRSVPSFSIPTAIAMLVAHAADLTLWALRREPQVKCRVRALTTPAWYDGGRFAARTGFRAGVGIAQGLALTASWLRRR